MIGGTFDVSDTGDQDAGNAFGSGGGNHFVCRRACIGVRVATVIGNCRRSSGALRIRGRIRSADHIPEHLRRQLFLPENPDIFRASLPEEPGRKCTSFSGDEPAGIAMERHEVFRKEDGAVRTVRAVVVEEDNLGRRPELVGQIAFRRLGIVGGEQIEKSELSSGYFSEPVDSSDSEILLYAGESVPCIGFRNSESPFTLLVSP